MVIVCKYCGSANVVPIWYGSPDQNTFQRAERDEIYLGGCVITGPMESMPNTYCKDCQTIIPRE